MQELLARVAQCRLCSDRFAKTHTAHAPRPVLWTDRGAPIRIIGQAPGARVHESGKPFTDPSGDRLRDWLDLSDEVFYDKTKVAIVPMAFCFPGYTAKGADLPPPPICARTWQDRVHHALGPAPLTLLVGGYAQKWHLKTKNSVTETVSDWRDHAPRVFPLPHPSWRNTGWIRKNPWFEEALLPALRRRLNEVLT